MNNGIKFKILIIIILLLFSYVLVSCDNKDNFTKINKVNNKPKEEFVLKNIKKPTKIIFYNKGKVIEIKQGSSKFDEIIKQVDTGLSGIKDCLKCMMNFKEEKQGQFLEIDYANKQIFKYQGTFEENKKEYKKIYINLNLKEPNYLDEFCTVSFSQENDEYGILYGNMLEYNELVEIINQK